MRHGKHAQKNSTHVPKQHTHVGFLDESTDLYQRVCPSVVGPLARPFVFDAFSNTRARLIFSVGIGPVDCIMNKFISQLTA